MRALIGLGNPGRDYRLTRHNIGFILLDYIQNKNYIPFQPGKGDYYFNEVPIAGQEVILVKPTAFMNRSGLAVVEVQEYFGLSKDDFLIIHDDFHLPFGAIRFRKQGSSGGHNGLKSIIYHLESEEFQRLKIGIGSPVDNAIDYVLSEFSKKELEQLDSALDKAFRGIQLWLKKGIGQAMNDFNGKEIDNSLIWD